MTTQSLKRSVGSAARKAMGGIVGALFGAGLGICSARLLIHTVGQATGGSGGLSRGKTAAELIAATGFSVFVSLIVHELGHLIGGRLVGFQLYLFTAGPLRVERTESDRLKVSFNREWSTYGGMCGNLPLDEENLLNRFAFSILCGPAASVILAVATYLGSLTMTGSLTKFELQILALTSLLIAVFTLIPMPNGAFLTDGARWFRLKRGGALAERDEALLRLYALLNSGTSPSEWSEGLIRQALAISDATMFEAAGHYFSYRRLLDTHNPVLAGVHLEQALKLALEKYPPMAVSYRIERAWYEAWHRNNPGAAQALLLEAGKAALHGRYDWDRKRAMAAIALRSGEISAGRTLIDEALSQMPAGKHVLLSKTQWEEMHTGIAG